MVVPCSLIGVKVRKADPIYPAESNLVTFELMEAATCPVTRHTFPVTRDTWHVGHEHGTAPDTGSGQVRRQDTRDTVTHIGTRWHSSTSLH